MNGNIPSGKLPKIPPDTMRYLTIGIEFIAVFSIFLVAGIVLDRRWSSAPICTVIGMVLGFAGAMYRIIRVAREHDWGRKGPPDTDDE